MYVAFMVMITICIVLQPDYSLYCFMEFNESFKKAYSSSLSFLIPYNNKI